MVVDSSPRAQWRERIDSPEREDAANADDDKEMPENGRGTVNIRAHVLLQAISERMVTCVEENGFEFADETAPPDVRLRRCFPFAQHDEAGEYIAAEVCKRLHPGEDGFYEVVVACAAMGSIHVGILSGLVVTSQDSGPRPSAGLACQLTNAEVAAIIELAREEQDRIRD